jgi:hypothetical protein
MKKKNVWTLAIQLFFSFDSGGKEGLDYRLGIQVGRAKARVSTILYKHHLLKIIKQQLDNEFL